MLKFRRIGKLEINILRFDNVYLLHINHRPAFLNHKHIHSVHTQYSKFSHILQDKLLQNECILNVKNKNMFLIIINSFQALKLNFLMNVSNRFYGNYPPIEGA